MARNDFVTQSQFSLPEDVLTRLKRSAFLTGRDPGPETTRAVVEAGLNVGAERESRFAEISANRRIQEEQLAQQESQFERSQALSRDTLARQTRESEKQRASAFKGGVVQAATTIAGFGILKHFKII